MGITGFIKLIEWRRYNTLCNLAFISNGRTSNNKSQTTGNMK